MSLSTPVAFIIFSRTDFAARVFAVIAQVKPKKLFVIQDAPRPNRAGEAEKCAQTRAIIDKVDWDCEVITNYSEVNMGPGRRIASGMDWVFSQVEEAIFLEEDALPSPTYFSFCEAMLERYRHDERIMAITGCNYVNRDRTNDSYYFSKYFDCWGWALWRRSWQHYDYYMKSWPRFQQSSAIDQIFEDSYEQEYWSGAFERMYVDPQEINTWDIQLQYAIWSQGGLVIVPNKNLIGNIGCNDLDGVHATGKYDPRGDIPVENIDEVKHPEFVIRNREADQHIFDVIHEGKNIRWRDQPLVKALRVLSFPIPSSVKKILKRVLKG
jgi:hypothetical protein